MSFTVKCTSKGRKVVVRKTDFETIDLFLTSLFVLINCLTWSQWVLHGLQVWAGIYVVKMLFCLRTLNLIEDVLQCRHSS